MLTQFKTSRARSRRRGFTLTELMVVIVILGLLATVVAPALMDRLGDAFGQKAVTDITTISQALDQYAMNNKMQYPDSLEALIQPDENGKTYLARETLPLDPWGNPYEYEPPGGGSSKALIWCYGRDGVQGGEGEDRDFNNVMIQNGEHP